MMPSSPPSRDIVRGMELSRSGWLEKYSVGRGLFPVKNWQRRYFTVSHSGLNYSKSKDVPADNRTYIPFVAAEGFHEIRMYPVFLLPIVTAAMHPEASDCNFFFFGIRFEEKGKPHLLLLRTTTASDRDQWVRFIGQYIHVGSLQGVPLLHPLDPSSPKTFDPEELDANEKRTLRRAVLEWDEGQDLRVTYGAASPEASMEDTAPSDDEHAGYGLRNGATPPRITPSASAAHTPRGGPGLVQLDDEDDIDRGRSGIQASSRSHMHPASATARSRAESMQRAQRSPPPPTGDKEFDVL